MAYESGEGVNPGNPLDQGNDSHSVETAAADFSAMLREEDTPSPKPRKPASQSSEASDGAAADGNGQSERQPRGERQEPDEADQDDRDPILDDAPEGDGEDEGEDGQDGEDEEDDQDGDDPLDVTHEITVNGEKLQVSVRDALAGYMKEADYRQGTERNAREYEEIQTFAGETVQARQRADQTIAEGLALLQALQPSKEDWDAMEANDPPGFIRAQKHWSGLLEKARGIIAAQNTLADDAKAQAGVERKKYFETQERQLVEKLPALRDEKRATAFRSAVMEYGLRAGYSEQELIEGAVDHRDLITLYKAARYDQIQNSKAAAGKAAGKNSPKNSAENRTRAPARTNPGKARRAADRNLRNSGSLKDAAESFTEMLRS